MFLREPLSEAGNPDGYRRLLRGFLGAGYQPTTFSAFNVAATQVILRHDVDLSLDLAQRMARIEAEEGCIATYFLLLSTQFYNLSSRNGRLAAHEILSLGHEIGLHFDPTCCLGSSSLQECEAAALQECRRLEDILGRAVTVTAVHRPGAVNREFLGMPGLFAGRMHAYDPRFFCDPGYVSDSAGDWSHGHPFDHPSFANRTGMQLLTHPYLWMHSGASTQRDKIDRSIRLNHEAMWAELPNNFRSYVASSHKA